MSDVPSDKNFYDRVTALEAELIRWAMKKSKGNQSQAAKLLSINRTTLIMKMKKMGLDGIDFSQVSNTQHDKASPAK